MTTATPVAEYVRMSTEHQRYSITYQQAANAAYAELHGLEIVKSYLDAGISGLSLRGRDGLQAMFADILGKRAPYSAVLVYDVSRWGRFQDPDEGAHYEFMCREAGVQVRYSAESFENDGTLASELLKSLKRIMAAEYSRELSVKVVRSKAGLRDLGYWQGGVPSYGYRRQIVNADGSRGAVLENTQQKSLQGCRTVLVLGPLHELEVIAWIFQRCLEGLPTRGIADHLNLRKVPAAGRGGWNRQKVRTIIRDRKCIGEYVVGRRTRHLKECRILPKTAWLTQQAPHLKFIDRATFDRAQTAYRLSKPWIPDDELEQSLRNMLAKHGRLSSPLLDADPEAYHANVYANRFGGMLAAYTRVGYAPSQKQVRCSERIRKHKPHCFRMRRVESTDQALIDDLRRLLRTAGKLTSDLIDMAHDLPSSRYYRLRFGSLAAAFELAGYIPPKRQAQMLRVSKRGQRHTPESYFSWAAPIGSPKASP